MVIVLLQLKVGPERKLHILQAIHAITGPTTAQAGCQLCKLLSNTQIEDELVLLQVWDTQESLEDHIRSEEFRNILAAMDQASAPPIITFNTVDTVEGLELVKKILGT